MSHGLDVSHTQCTAPWLARVLRETSGQNARATPATGAGSRRKQQQHSPRAAIVALRRERGLLRHGQQLLSRPFFLRVSRRLRQHRPKRCDRAQTWPQEELGAIPPHASPNGAPSPSRSRFSGRDQRSGLLGSASIEQSGSGALVRSRQLRTLRQREASLRERSSTNRRRVAQEVAAIGAVGTATARPRRYRRGS